MILISVRAIMIGKSGTKAFYNSENPRPEPVTRDLVSAAG